MATHTMTINPLSFGLIRDGSKSLEVRLRRDGVETYAVGDALEIRNRESGESMTRSIDRLSPYPSLDELMKHEDLTLTGAFSDATAFRERMRSFQTEDEERQFGLVAIHLR